jgi:hypothetical protein
MMGRTEERLRDATTALGDAVQQRDIPELRLPAAVRLHAPTRTLWPLRHQAQVARVWLMPAAAAASVLVVVGLLVFVSGLGQGGNGRTGRLSDAAAGIPRYMVTYGGGLGFVPGGGPGYVRVAATGKVVARIRPAGTDFTVEGLAAAPGDRTFYLIGEDTAGAGSGNVKIECFKIVIGRNGHPGRPRLLPGAPLFGPLPPTSDAATTIPLAISPDGTELAYPYPGEAPSGSAFARRPQSIIVQNVVTGARRFFSAWPSAGTQIGDVSWGAGGRLGFVAILTDAKVSHGTVVPAPGNELSVFMMLSTQAAGTQLIPASQLISWGSGPMAGSGIPAPNPPAGPVGAVLSPGGMTAYLRISQPQSAGGGRLVAISTVTGTVVRVPVSAQTALRSAPVGIDGKYLLVTLAIAHPVHRGGRPWVSGHLAGINLATGQIAVLPFPTYASSQAPVAPFESAW